MHFGHRNKYGNLRELFLAFKTV